MVEGTRLESVRCGNVSGGSNPPLSAKAKTGTSVPVFALAERGVRTVFNVSSSDDTLKTGSLYEPCAITE